MSAMSDLDTRVQQLEALGFTATPDEESPGYLRIKCDRCEALVINGVPAHETGCPNAMRECSGCNNLIPALRFRRFCEECM